MADIKWSHFPSATPGNYDEVVGLHGGDNARFTIANIIAAVRQGLASIFVPLARTINGKALNNDISLSASDVGAVDTDDVGVADGVASLDSNGKVPGTQLDLSGKQSTITANGILKGDGQGGVSAATAGTDYATPAQLEGKANQAQLAYVETGTTASRNYTAGQYISLSGLLYTADTAIASGATFYTSGGNKNLTECVGGGFNNLGGSVQTNSTEATVRYVKIGKMVVVSAYGTYVSNNRVVLGDIPDPFVTQFAIVYRNSNSGGYSNAMVFQENGTYKLSFYGATPPTNTTFVCSFSYVSV